MGHTEQEFLKTRENLSQGRRLLEDMKADYQDKVEIDKLMDKNFKKEFPGLGFHQVSTNYRYV